MERINWDVIYSELEKTLQFGNADDFNEQMDLLKKNISLLNENEKKEILPQIVPLLKVLLLKTEKQFQIVDEILEDGNKKESANNQYGKY